LGRRHSPQRGICNRRRLQNLRLARQSNENASRTLRSLPHLGAEQGVDQSADCWITDGVPTAPISLCVMDWLPMVPASCSRDQDELGTQLERYRVAGHGAQLIEQHSRRLVIRVSDGASTRTIEKLVAVKRSMSRSLSSTGAGRAPPGDRGIATGARASPRSDRLCAGTQRLRSRARSNARTRIEESS
jgi:hypothetical protein